MGLEEQLININTAEAIEKMNFMIIFFYEYRILLFFFNLGIL